jgi:ankyrin repeat protein
MQTAMPFQEAARIGHVDVVQALLDAPVERGVDGPVVSHANRSDITSHDSK